MAKASLSNKYDKADKKVQRISKSITAIIVIMGAITGACSWVNSQFQEAVASQINEFRDESRAADKRHDQATTRLELMMLIEHDPTNKAAIEKMAKYYFITLDGDLYITQKYSEWAEQYGGDISIIVGEK